MRKNELLYIARRRHVMCT